ncbi:hypothetical protein U1Q18_026861 [Sarracenia purpurea var. burkii]
MDQNRIWSSKIRAAARTAARDYGCFEKNGIFSPVGELQATAKLAGLTAAAGEAQITGGERRAWCDQHRRRRRNRKQTLGAVAPQPCQRTGARRTPGAATASPCTARGGQVRRRSSGAGGEKPAGAGAAERLGAVAAAAIFCYGFCKY